MGTVRAGVKGVLKGLIMVHRIDYTKKDGEVAFSNYWCNCEVPKLGYYVGSGSGHICMQCGNGLSNEYLDSVGLYGAPAEDTPYVYDWLALRESEEVQEFLSADITVVTVEKLNR